MTRKTFDIEPFPSEDKATQKLADGTITKPLFIKHLSKGDWDIINSIKEQHSYGSVADSVRWIIRKVGGRV